MIKPPIISPDSGQIVDKHRGTSALVIVYADQVVVDIGYDPARKESHFRIHKMKRFGWLSRKEVIFVEVIINGL